MLPRNRRLKDVARKLRKEMTDAERILWSVICGKQLKQMQFYRQKNIGNYIVDFYCHQAKLVIEVDGGQHFTVEGKESDESRDSYLQSLGLKVLRFTNIEVKANIEGVVQRILEII